MGPPAVFSRPSSGLFLFWATGNCLLKRPETCLTSSTPAAAGKAQENFAFFLSARKTRFSLRLLLLLLSLSSSSSFIIFCLFLSSSASPASPPAARCLFAVSLARFCRLLACLSCSCSCLQPTLASAYRLYLPVQAGLISLLSLIMVGSSQQQQQHQQHQLEEQSTNDNPTGEYSSI